MPSASPKPILSVIVPAHNEESVLPACIASIHSALGDKLPYEIVIGVHNCSDGTERVALEYGAKAIRVSGGSIAHVRNTAVQKADGAILLFLDADVTLDVGWHSALEPYLSRMIDGENLLVGSRCRPPSSASWLAKAWFHPATSRGRPAHLGTGHMVVPHALFVQIEGFSENLQTGEDYDFCQRATASGATLISDPALIAYHLGVPHSPLDFVRREAWHGSGDAGSLRSASGSLVFWATMAFMLVHVFALGLCLVTSPGIGFGAWFVGALGLCLGTSLYKFSRAPWFNIVQLTLLHYLYFCGRSISVIAALLGRSPSRTPIRPNTLTADKDPRNQLPTTARSPDLERRDTADTGTSRR